MVWLFSFCGTSGQNYQQSSFLLQNESHVIWSPTGMLTESRRPPQTRSGGPLICCIRFSWSRSRGFDSDDTQTGEETKQKLNLHIFLKMIKWRLKEDSF